MVTSPKSTPTSEGLLAAGTLEDIAGQATRTCESCGVEKVPVGPCFIRDQALSGFSNPNTRICLYAARRPLHADVYPPYDQSTWHALEEQLFFVPRSENIEHRTQFENTLKGIQLSAKHVVEVSNAFEDHQVVVLKAPTGFGKSTKLPYWLCWHEDSKFSKNSGKVIVTEPKRLAAEGVAGTVSMAHQFQGPAPGLDVGLQHGGVSSSGESNKLVFVTDGSLINRLIKRELEDVQLIIVDEAHERNERIELILLILRFLLPQYPHLKLLILSATIDPHNFTTYFQPEEKSYSDSTCGKAPFVAIRATEIKWEDTTSSPFVTDDWFAGEFKLKFAAQSLGNIVRKACDKAKQENGHVLVFLPGEPEIDKLFEQIKDVKGFEIQRLSGKTPQEERNRIQNVSADEKRLIILATNVAESSVTFKDLVCVVDSGLSKRSKNDDLEVVQITKAEQRQRRGRVGRNRAGWYYPAFSENDKNGFKEYPDSSLVDLSDYHREVMLLQAMSVGIHPTILEEPQSYLMAPKELKEPTRRVVKHIRTRGGLAGKASDEYLTPVGLLAAQAGVSVELAQLLLIGDHHNVLTEMSAVVANMSWRREHKRLAGVDVTDLLPDHVDSVSPSTSQNGLDPEFVDDEFGDNDSLLQDEPDEDPIDDEDIDADELRVRRDVVGELRDSYLLQSFDKLEEEKFGLTAALMAKQGLEDAKRDAFLRLEKTNRIQQQFQERVPEDRLREIDPRLFDRVQLAVNCWRTNGWRFELSLFADANLIHMGSKKVEANKEKTRERKNSATKREKNLQKLWELEGQLVRSHGSKADDIILSFVRSLRAEKKEHRVVAKDKFATEYDGRFKDLKDSHDKRRSNRHQILNHLKDFLSARDSQDSLAEPLEIIVDASNICRDSAVCKKLDLDPRVNADINQIVELMDDLRSVVSSSNQGHHGPRNSLISNLGRHLVCIDGEIDEETRAKLVPELTMPVGSRWRRKEGTAEIIRNEESENRFIEELSSSNGYSLLPRTDDNLTDEAARVVGAISDVLDTVGLTDKCFFADMLKKQYLTTPAKEAQSLRQGDEGQSRNDAELPTGDYFRARRAPASKTVDIIPSYLEKEVIEEMKQGKLSTVQFSIYRDHNREHYVTGRDGEVKSVKVKLKISDNFQPVVELGAWQVCPWFSAVPDQKEYGSLQPKKDEKKQILHSKMPEKLLEFGEHTMEIVPLGGPRLLCTTYDKTGERSNFVKEMAVLEGESVESQRARIAKAATAFKKSHQNLARVWAQPKIVTITIPLDKVGRVIGSKGKVINTIQQETGAFIAVDDDGSVGIVTIGSPDAAKVEEARTRILNIVDPPTAGSVRPPRSTVAPTPSRMRPSTAVPSGRSTTRASRAKSSSPSRAKKSSRRWIWVTLIGVGIIGLWMQSSFSRQSNSNDVSGSPENEVLVTTPFSPTTPDDWFDALNCVEDPSERTVGSAATAIFICYSESNPERDSISLFQYDNPPDQSELNRRVQRACTKRGPTGEVFALSWPGQPAFFIYTIYADAVARSRPSNLFERLSC